MKRKSYRKCCIEGCERNAEALDMCLMHYQRVKNGISDMRPGRLPHLGNKGGKWKPDDPRYKRKGWHCSVPGCENKYYAKGFCHNHYSLNARNGSPEYKKIPIVKCSIDGCENYGPWRKGLCKFHLDRKRNGIILNRPKGIKGDLNPNWNGGVAQYPNHYQMKKNRLVVLQAANYICQYCGELANEVHHKDLSKTNHNLDNLVAVCKKCHAKLRKQYTSKFIRAYGKTLRELALRLNCSTSKISCLHKNGKLRNMVLSEDVVSILY